MKIFVNVARLEIDQLCLLKSPTCMNQILVRPGPVARSDNRRMHVCWFDLPVRQNILSLYA